MSDANRSYWSNFRAARALFAGWTPDERARKAVVLRAGPWAVLLPVVAAVEALARNGDLAGPASEEAKPDA